jgi:ATP-dependent Clp protease ATP-binding subunit ClpB
MDQNKLTIKSQEALQQAQFLATSNNQQAVENAHLLKALLEVDENVVPFLLKKSNVNLPQLTATLDTQIKSFPKVEGGNPYLSADANKSLTKAFSYLKDFKDEFVSLEHLLLGILAGKDNTSQLLKDAGVNEKNLKAAIIELRKGERVTSATAEETYQSLSKYAKNLNELAQSGKLDPVIGRDEEIRRVLQILSRRKK